MSSSAPSAAAARKARVYTRPEIEALIAEGRHIVILDGKVLKCDGWMKFHPGGDKSIKHMVGRDATDEVKAYARSRTHWQIEKLADRPPLAVSTPKLP